MSTYAALIKTIHVARRELGLSEENYRALVKRITGADSCKGLPTKTLEAVIAEFKRLGWQPFKGQAKSGKPYVRKIYGLWRSLCDQGMADVPTRTGLHAFVKRQTGIDNPEWLITADANKVIEALKSWGARELSQKPSRRQKKA